MRHESFTKAWCRASHTICQVIKVFRVGRGGLGGKSFNMKEIYKQILKIELVKFSLS